MFCKQFLAYAVHIDWCYHAIQNIQVGLNIKGEPELTVVARIQYYHKNVFILHPRPLGRHIGIDS